MPPPPTPEPVGPTDPPPANWLRGAGLIAFTGIIVADTYDGRLDAEVWALMIGLGVIVWGPSVLNRSVWRR